MINHEPKWRAATFPFNKKNPFLAERVFGPKIAAGVGYSYNSELQENLNDPAQTTLGHEHLEHELTQFKKSLDEINYE
ncbi:MAG: hypothetical protein CVV03_06785 [Firmicutes bacterium HGW-Firmicutes-8]|nr:MAG: hypothetical protein CVV03_06785 [Firmicutes bacterium HGW-Firmicutes-8]